jgi:hypothetical protein
MPNEPADRLRERSERSVAVSYLLMGADRRLVAAGIVAFVFFGLIAASVVAPGAAAALGSGDPVETAFQSLVGATITGVTVVLTLNQLVLSQELGAVGDQRERMEGAMSFREDVGAMLGTTPPTEPSAFLRSMIAETADRAEAVRASGDLSEDLERLLESTVRNADRVVDRLEGRAFGEFGVVRAALDFNYSWKLYATRRALEEDGPSAETHDALEAFEDSLRLFGPAREHFKTLYVQSELTELSRLVLYTAVPSLVVAVSVLFFVDPGTYPGTVFGIEAAVALISAGVAVSVIPFAVLLAYILRIATVTGRTLSIGPFVLRETERDPDG